MTENNNKENDIKENISELANLYFEAYKEKQAYLEKYYPTDIPNDVCNHAFVQGIKFENSFKPRVHDFIPFMKYGDEELFLWTHTKDKDTGLVSRVSKTVKEKNFWKNIGTVTQLAYSYTREFEHTMDIEYKWCYYFDQNKPLNEQEIYDCSELERLSLQNGTILKLTDFYLLARIIELLLRDDKLYTAMSTFYASMKTHYCCLICELERHPYRMHPSHEPKLWEQANVISEYETAIVQACRCVEAFLGKPPKKDNKNRLLQHKQKWIDELGINPDDHFKKGDSTYIDFYYDLFQLRNAAAHSFGTIPFDLKRKQAINAQCFASLLLDGYLMKNIISEEKAIVELSINRDIINKVDENMSTSKTYNSEQKY
jgi:hypothetical protein